MCQWGSEEQDSGAVDRFSFGLEAHDEFGPRTFEGVYGSNGGGPDVSSAPVVLLYDDVLANGEDDGCEEEGPCGWEIRGDGDGLACDFNDVWCLCGLEAGSQGSFWGGFCDGLAEGAEELVRGVYAEEVVWNV